MSQPAYPTLTDLIKYLHGAGFLSSTLVTAGAASATQAVTDTSGMRVGDTLYFATTNTTRTITIIVSATSVTVSATVTTVTNEVVVIAPFAMNLASMIAAGIEAFELAAGRKMLALTDTIHQFDPPTDLNSILPLRGDLSQLTAVYTGGTGTLVTTGADSATQTVTSTAGMAVGQRLWFEGAQVARTVLLVNSAISVTLDSTVTTSTGERVVSLSASVRGSAFRLMPSDAAPKGLPWSYLQISARYFAPLAWTTRGSLFIEGRWAYSATAIPDLAWQAMLAYAGLTTLAQNSQALTGGLVEWAEADMRERYGDEPLGGFHKQLESQTMQAAQYYRRVTVGV